MTPYTTDDLLTSVKNRGMLPDASTGSLSSAALLQYGSEELQGPLMSLILSARENFYLAYTDYSVVTTTDTYPLPVRAAGGVLAVPQWIYQNRVVPLTPIDPGEVVTTNTATYPRAFYFRNNSVVVYPQPNTAVGTLRLQYFQRPSRLAQTSACAVISSFDANAKTVTVTAIPTAWTTNTVIDFVPVALPYTPYGLDTVLTGVAGTVMSMAALPTGIAVGDYVSLAGTTPIPEVPYEWFHVLSERILCTALASIGDKENLQFAQGRLKEYQDAALKLITPRDQNGPKKIVSSWRAF